MSPSFRLGGWHRLFLILAFFYFIAVSLFFAKLIPTAADDQETRLFDTVNLIREHRPDYFSESWTYKVVDSIIEQGPEEWLEKVHGVFRGMIDFSPIEQRYQQDLQNLTRDQRKTVLTALGFWGIPVGVVYVLGQSVGWIIAGFRKPEGSTQNEWHKREP